MEKKGEMERREKQGMALSRTRHVTGGGGGKHYIQKPVEELRRSRLWATTGLE